MNIMKTILTLLIALIMVSCNGGTKVSTTEDNTSVVKSEKITDEVGIGLYKVELDSNTTILIYRADPASDGTESISMIQLK
jgi:hypothetical protein